MVTCPDCGEEVPDAKFCKNCGAELSKVKEVVEIPANSQNDVKFCHNCGFKLENASRFCPNCGYDLENKKSVNNNVNHSYVVNYEEKSMLLSVVLSIIFPGLGHIYLGLNRKGATFLIAYVISAVLIFILIGLLLCTVLWIWALIDVIQSTNALNRGESVEDKLL